MKKWKYIRAERHPFDNGKIEFWEDSEGNRMEKYWDTYDKEIEEIWFESENELEATGFIFDKNGGIWLEIVSEKMERFKILIGRKK